MWMNQKTVFLPGTWALGRETDVGRQEEGRGSANRTQRLGHGCRENASASTSVTGRVRRGVGHQDGDTNGERDKNRVWERGADGACES